MNASFFLCTQIVSIISFSTESIQEIGRSLFNQDINFTSFVSYFNTKITVDSETFNMFSLDGIIKSIFSFGTMSLVISYSLRYILINVFTIISPFAILCLIHQNSSWFFKSWLRNYLSLLFIQIFIAIILTLPHVIYSKDNPDLLNKLFLLGIIYALLKANDYIREFMGGLSFGVSSPMANIKSYFSK